MMAALCIGIGNEYRGDDAVGLYVARTLRKKNLPGLRALEHTGEGIALIEAWSDAGKVFIVDAVSSGAQPGTLYRIDPYTQSIPTDFFAYSTHTFGIPEAVELSRELGKLPPQLLIYGIEGDCFALRVGITPVVEETANRVVEYIKAAVSEC